jgi:4-hydroxybenzoate polyprenyltransferase
MTTPGPQQRINPRAARWARAGALFHTHLDLALTPLLERFRRGEGALLAVNAAIVWFQAPPLLEGAAKLVISLFVLAALYAFNDLYDAEDDRSNPKKDQRLVTAFLENRGAFSAVLAAFHLALVVLAYVFLGGSAAVATIVLFAVNILYSVWLKGVPIADLIVVGLWGGLYSAVVLPSWRLCVLVGVMTAVCHIFQALGDREVDANNRVQTTAVFSPSLTTGALGIVCGVLYLVLLPSLGALWSLSAFLPLATMLGLGGTGAAAWMLSRIYFGLALLAVLGGFPSAS